MKKIKDDGKAPFKNMLSNVRGVGGGRWVYGCMGEEGGMGVWKPFAAILVGSKMKSALFPGIRTALRFELFFGGKLDD